ncbi:MAG TPA: glucosaminidase domain-containing protein [Saprospiraceae bacterium]|nr:glucosaminidase domain-containing protein [Saprospiraceae bacterium]
MQIKPILLSLCCLLWGAAFSQAGDDDRQRYVDQFSWLAVQEMERTGVPASVKLGQAILESRWGTSDLARSANNHFGIKCGGSWTGGSYYKKDDDYVLGKLVPSCFRAYSSVQESFVAHSNFLMANRRYAELFALKTNDYKGWARGLKKAGYATARHYHRSLINVIEELGLDKYDHMSSADFGLLANRPGKQPTVTRPGVLPPNGPADAPKTDAVGAVQILSNNDVKYVVSQAGETLESLSDRLNVPVKWLLSYNSNVEEATEELDAGEWIYIQPKRKNYRGRQKWHEVSAQDNMFSLSQRYGISLNQLYERNQMIPGTEPAVGAQVKIRGWKVKTAPALRPIKGRGRVAGQVPPQSKPEALAQNIPRSARSPGYAQLIMEQEKAPRMQDKDQVSSGAVFHRVAIGDDLNKIAAQYNQTTEQLREWNQLAEKATLMVGMRLRVQ